MKLFVAQLDVAFIGRLSRSRVTSCHEIWDDAGVNAFDSLQSWVVSLHHEASSVVENISSLELLLFKIKVFLIYALSLCRWYFRGIVLVLPVVSWSSLFTDDTNPQKKSWRGALPDFFWGEGASVHRLSQSFGLRLRNRTHNGSKLKSWPIQTY